jgi:hypothetical protein
MWWKLIDEYAEGDCGRQVVVAVEVDASTSASSEQDSQHKSQGLAEPRQDSCGLTRTPVQAAYHYRTNYWPLGHYFQGLRCGSRSHYGVLSD